MTPRVTVLMTVYNGVPYLREAIDSVLAQTFRDFELLIIDDASTDQSAARIESFGDPRIRLIRNPRNLGQTPSLNLGMAESRGRYIARMDQDDVCLPDRLQQQVACLDARSDVAAVGTWAFLIGPEGRATEMVGTRVDEFGTFLGMTLTFASPIGHPTLVIRRDVLAAFGGYDESFAPCEDYALWCHLAERRHGLVSIPRPLMKLRRHAQQQSRVRLAAQQAQGRRAHARLLSAWADAEHLDLISSLLRGDDAFWQACPTKHDVRQALAAWNQMRTTMTAALRLSPEESARLNHRVRWWFGHNAAFAALQGRRQSLPLYTASLEGGISMLRYPAVASYPVLLAASPLFGATLRKICKDAVMALGRQKYVARLMTQTLKNRWQSAQASGREILYVSYDGMLEPLGASQVVSYLLPMAVTRRITLLSYEKPSDRRDVSRYATMRQRLEAAGIRWIPLRYHKRPSLLATGWDALIGIIVGWIVCRRRQIRLIHARGYVPSVIALTLKRATGARFLFDMRGFWPEEKVDAGHWRRGSLAYRLTKWCERKFFEQADAIVSLTHAGVKAFDTLGYQIPAATPIDVIPTCADTSRFSPEAADRDLQAQLGLQGKTVIGCVGTLSNWYLRTPTLRYCSFLLRHLEHAVILCVTQEDHAQLRRDAQAAGIPPERFRLARAAFEQMPGYLSLMHVGVFFITPTFSKTASAATKLAEFLASGVPVVINDLIGDSGGVVREHRVGVVLRDVAEREWTASLQDVQALLADAACARRCRNTALALFDLRDGVKKYLALYDRFAENVEPLSASVVRPLEWAKS
ncbi:MAG: glycosyltransferase [Candidatus Omnitrophica bacterium]|nr:glycosyltransferase [Candidatus Omnitrophota bacterium]